jgi:hypothetical protein
MRPLDRWHLKDLPETRLTLDVLQPRACDLDVFVVDVTQRNPLLCSFSVEQVDTSIVHHDPNVVEGLLEGGLVIVNGDLDLVDGVLACQSVETSHDLAVVVPVLLLLLLVLE